MGASGEDILFSPAARRVYPYSIECKNQESLNIWKAIEQAEAQGKHIPLVAFKKNNRRTYVAIPFDHWIELINDHEFVKTLHSIAEGPHDIKK